MVASAAVRASGGARWRASAWDYLVVVAWIAVLSGLGAGIRAALPGGTTIGLAGTDGLAFACSVFPVWLYLVATESGNRQASWGKRRAGLRVVGPAGSRPGWVRIAVRETVKLLPWQLAHLAVARLLLGEDAPVLIATTYGLSLLLPLVSTCLAWRDPLRRGLHDLAAGTRVVLAT